MIDDLDLLAFGPTPWGERHLAKMIDRECCFRKRVLTPSPEGRRRAFMLIDLTNDANYDQPLFPVRVAAAVAGIEGATLRAWFMRGHLALSANDAEQEKDGMPRYLTFRSVLHIAATARLASKGVQIAVAYQAVTHWVHTGDFHVASEERQNEREPAGLYPGDDWTLLIHFGGTDATVARAPVYQNRLCMDIGDILRLASAGPTIIFLNPLVATAQRLCSAYLADRDG